MSHEIQRSRERASGSACSLGLNSGSRRLLLVVLAAATALGFVAILIALHAAPEAFADRLYGIAPHNVDSKQTSPAPTSRQQHSEVDAVSTGAEAPPIAYATPATPVDPAGNPLPPWAVRRVKRIERALSPTSRATGAAVPSCPAFPHSPPDGAKMPSNDAGIFSSVVEAAAEQRNPRSNIAVFTQGNSGFHPLTKNWVAMMKSLQPAVPFFVVALDADEFERIKAIPAPVVFDPNRAFDPKASEYRKEGYNKMTLNKWSVALEVLKAGVDAFMVDPDIAMLRNPLGYFESLPACDYTTMMEGDTIDGTANDVIKYGGFFQVAYKVPYDNLMNTGYSLFRSTPRMIALMESFMAYLRGVLDDWSKPAVEDQTHWANFIHERFHIRGVAPDAPAPVRGKAVVDAVLRGECIEYVSKADGSPGFSFQPLNPHMFMNRPAFDKRKLHEKVLERPFAVHYNYLVGTAAKVAAMRKNGHYVVD